MAEHKWKEFSDLLGVPYDERFSTNGYGDWKIDSYGLYSYEKNMYTSDDNCWDYIYSFLSGEIELEE